MKVYVEVFARFDTDGVMIPVAFTWEDGKRFLIDQVKTRQRCASQTDGSTGIMFVVKVKGRDCHLYYDFDKWFMERKSA